MVAAAVVTALAIAGLYVERQRAPHASFVDGGVAVDVTLDGRLRVTLTPVDPGFHVYSLDLPDDGVDGLGIPTRLSVSGGLRGTGEVSASPAATAVEIAELGITLPVYPDGPVRLDLPVDTVGPVGTVRLTYGACSEDTCLAPVRDHTVDLDLTGVGT